MWNHHYIQWYQRFQNKTALTFIMDKQLKVIVNWLSFMLWNLDGGNLYSFNNNKNAAVGDTFNLNLNISDIRLQQQKLSHLIFKYCLDMRNKKDENIVNAIFVKFSFISIYWYNPIHFIIFNVNMFCVYLHTFMCVCMDQRLFKYERKNGWKWE